MNLFQPALLNAFLTLRLTATLNLCALPDGIPILSNFLKASSFDRSLGNLYCLPKSPVISLTCFSSLLAMSPSNILPTSFRRQSGFYDNGIPFGLRTFFSNTNWPFFHMVGKVPVFRHVLRTPVNRDEQISWNASHTLLGMQSRPGALFLDLSRLTIVACALQSYMVYPTSLHLLSLSCLPYIFLCFV